MAAISTVFLTLLRTGEHLVCVDPCYGGTQALLAWGREHFGWDYTLVDARRPDTWEAAFRPNTRVLHLESPINPTLAVLDVAAAAAMGKRHGCVVTIDNTIASPLGQRPLEMGCDISLYSATKSIGGHSDLLAGAAMGSWKHLRPAAFTRMVFGPIADPAMAWMIERSLKTMPLRVRRTTLSPSGVNACWWKYKLPPPSSGDRRMTRWPVFSSIQSRGGGGSEGVPAQKAGSADNVSSDNRRAGQRMAGR